MNAIELAQVLEDKSTLPLAHEAADMLRKQHSGISMALKALQRGNELDVPMAIDILKAAL